jgi:regulator of protease activity HflC (stomatin/prohibitin superfamily)
MIWLISLLIIIVLWIGVTYWRKAEVVISETDVGVVFTRRQNNFARFLRPGVHFINPVTEKLEATIFTGTQSASGKMENLRTKEGIPVSIAYNISIKVDPFSVASGLEYKMARALPKYAAKMAEGRVTHILRYFIEQKTIEELYKEDAIKKLEDQVRPEVYERGKAIGFQPLSINDLKLGPITMPEQVETALKTHYERNLQTETSIDALERLHAVISKFEDRHIDRLSELERLRIVENSGSLVYLMDSLVKKVHNSAELATNGTHN